MLQRKNSIATSAWGLALAIAVGVCQAQSIGTVTDLQGTLLSKNTVGAIKILALDSSIESGDRLLTRPGTYARMAFTDRTAVTLGPESELVIVQYSYSDTALANSAVFDFVQGRVQIAAGRLGARSVDRFILNTSTATIVVGGATFIAGYTAPPGTARLHFPLSPRIDRGPWTDAGHFENVLYHPPTDGASRPRLLLAQNTIPGASSGGRSPGLYVQVLDGMIHLTNGGGTQNFTAGQFGFTPGFKQPPVILPTNPGMQFTPPPSFSSTIGASGGTTAPKSGDVNCQVR
jgi:FecR-like protein